MAVQNLSEIQDMADLRPQDIDNISEIFGERFANNSIKTNQIRNMYSGVNALRTKLKASNKSNGNDLDEDLMMEFVLLKPQMAYSAGRQKRNDRQIYDEFYNDIIKQSINLTQNSKNQVKSLENFISIIESIVAYHKFYGGKD